MRALAAAMAIWVGCSPLMLNTLPDDYERGELVACDDGNAPILLDGTLATLWLLGGLAGIDSAETTGGAVGAGVLAGTMTGVFLGSAIWGKRRTNECSHAKARTATRP